MIPIIYFIAICIIFAMILLREYLGYKALLNQYQEVVAILGQYVIRFGDFEVNDKGDFRFLNKIQESKTEEKEE